MQIEFKLLDPDSMQDMDLYEELIIKGMLSEDTHSRCKFQNLLRSNYLKSWWVYDEDEIVGWCCLCIAYNKYFSEQYHFYGSWVAPHMRRKGIASKMLEYRLLQTPDNVVVTTSIQPQNTASIALAKKFGFEKYYSAAIDGIWDCYIFKRKNG